MVKNFSGQRLSIEEVRQVDIVDYLFKIGYSRSKIKDRGYWYLSPLSDEKKRSFKVNRRLYRWYDYGQGKGRNIIDFAILYNNCTVGEFLQQLSGNLSFQKPFIIHQEEKFIIQPENKINILLQRPICSLSLLRYLNKRRIPIDLAECYCKEIIYEVNGKNILLSALKIIPVVMNYVTLGSKEVAHQKTSHRLTTMPQKR